jgi:ATP-binding cassette subfamily F protein uup
LQEIRQRFEDPEIYRDGAAAVKSLQDEMAATETELASAYARWELLETRKSTGSSGENR